MPTHLHVGTALTHWGRFTESLARPRENLLASPGLFRSQLPRGLVCPGAGWGQVPALPLKP